MTYRLIIPAAAALVLACAPAPAHASATITDGKVTLSVRGHGLRVQRADGWMDGHRQGASARLYTVYKGEWPPRPPRRAPRTRAT
ncbi:hypothetical protein [Streptomyces misionensis]|uniref:hypothetical protein n=1 Tax=Streptomyces misionensis TaxID=67331 RepID=UPI00369ACD95